MKILHGTWIPDAEVAFVQHGAFYLWIETTDPPTQKSKQANSHPLQLPAASFADFLNHELGIKILDRDLEKAIVQRYFLLPSTSKAPLPSLELSRYLEQDSSETFEWQTWQVNCYTVTTYDKSGSPVSNVIRLLNELHFIALHNLAEIQLGADLLFWYHYTQAFKTVILKDQYIPALKYQQANASPSRKERRTRRSKSTKASQPEQQTIELYPAWEIVSEQYESTIERYLDSMPLVCVAGFATPPEAQQFYDRETILRHCSEYLLQDIVTHTPSAASFEKKIADTLIHDCMFADRHGKNHNWETYEQWRGWRDRIQHTQTAIPFNLCFQLQDPAKAEDAWELQFLVAPKSDPSRQISLLDYWRLKPERQEDLLKHVGEGFEQHLLLNLGYAARIYPKLWQGLETDQPTHISLSLDIALDFLQEAAWVLEAAGYKVIVPAWWTPQGRQRAKVKLRAKGKSLSSGEDKANSYFSIEKLVQYKYELAIGGKKVSEQEWSELVQAKFPLVQFRGQWLHLDQDKMQQMLEFWKTRQAENPEMSLLEIMRLGADGGDDLELDFNRDQSLAEMMAKLHDKSQLDTIADPEQLQGTLRDYQKRGVSWLHYLEQLGLNGCLADDMGLGKTVQVIARLVQERELAAQENLKVPPTLLIAPTSVVGNWRREMQKFAPHLTAIVHHGGERAQDSKDFKAMVRQNDLVITSFTLARKDSKLLSAITWQRVVLDEAQNIKNPKAAQTKAILKLNAQHRLALTGTPVENRLLDLWSIFNFLNPGYLGKQAQFRKSFEVPIQKQNDRVQSATLKKLVEPFILRRMKTDKSIIKDLPDKVEQKLYCNLTKEQASLYEAVVKEVAGELDELDGIQRKGMILSTLMKLKQICNHPRQFLQDESDFIPERSHKLGRLTEMITEAIDEGESLLVFTQFTELGDALQKYISKTQHYKTYYIHGGTSRNKREQMISEFQDPETEPSVFILSLKAGGVGITLTKANHVFHFDRWWNPAVEDQATDRAFRIGQKKNVFVHKFVAMGTLEERIDEMIEDKKRLAGSIVGSDESWLTELDNEAFKKLIALNKTAILE
ncbi:DEAD/DEAH box helicase [Acaryochloris thomasi]|nr:DEAD/DEAH box helicase [Acaryochloris thomasi]